MKILLDRPKNAYDMFEQISADVKQNPMNPEASDKSLPPSAEEVEKQLQWAKACSKLLLRPDEPPEVNVTFPDLMDDSNLFEWAGISFGRSETYRLYLSIKKFSETLGAEVERLRFFGLIKTRGAPYYVVEGLTAEDEEGVDEAEQEGRSGANKYTYWVTQSVESNVWVQLPNVTCKQVVIARKFKRFLTGNLDAAVPSFPPFPGVEKNLLRTQIARIAGSTLVSPAGYFELNEDEDPPVVKLAEAETLNEMFPKPASELKEPDGWVHHEIELNELGRATAMPEVLDDNGDPIEPEEPVEVTPPLKNIEGEQWAFRACPGGAGEFDGSVVAARSLVWPGAFAIAAAKRFVNVYVGYGVMYEAKTYSPPLPQPLQVEWVPVEDEEPLVDQEDVRVDPTPPKEEGEDEED